MNNKHSAPLYRELSRALRQELAEGHHAVGAFLPPLRQLAERFRCSLTTVQQALRELESEGLLSSDSTRGVRVRAFPATAEPMGRIVCVFPKWDTLREESFAAQFLLGVGMAATAAGFVAEPVAFENLDELEPLFARLQRRPPAGLVWANPTFAAPLARLSEAGLRVVTVIRHFPGTPHTHDAMEEAFPKLLEAMRHRGARRLGVLAMGDDDPTYEPQLRQLLAAAEAQGLTTPPELLSRARTDGLDRRSRELLTLDLLAHLRPGDGLFASAPDCLELALELARKQGRDLESECVLAVHSIRAAPLPAARFTLESDVRAHGERAVRMVRQWLDTNRPPAPAAVNVRLVSR